MKKTVKSILLIMLSFGLALAICGCTPVKTAEEMGMLQSFEYVFGSGFSDIPIYEYSLSPETDDVSGNFILQRKNCIIDEVEYSKTLDRESVDRFSALIFESGVATWDGFNKNSGCVDGYEWHLRAQFENGEIIAYGNMRYPENYDDAHKAMIEFFDGFDSLYRS